MIESVLSVLSHHLKLVIRQLSAAELSELEELRIRQNRPLEIISRGRSRFLTADGTVTDEPGKAYHPTSEDCAKLLDLLTNHSVYSYEEELKRGFITISGGHRVGLAGRTVLEQGQVKLLREISSFNIRIARERTGCASQLLPLLSDARGGSILLVSPPQHGKTTMLRDLARSISGGYTCGQIRVPGRKVGIIDERSEIAACVKGVPTFDVGPRTDVLDHCPKAEGMMMMIRSMSPEVLIVDELGRDEDAAAVHEAIHAGIQVLATAHAASLGDIEKRPGLRTLYESRAFSRYIVLRKLQDKVRVAAAFDESGSALTLAAAAGTSGR
ncbi:stage III sporulation protein AA [Paenibacillus senegalensis]|uniref:stage III sporulation protein AA n=1 Tax=Paenibacillus senegalensis TaxID=1465766 RepID=UPI000289A37E|nr:stage III sporulation protein AA [Paenibacillus senegalensis]